MPKESDSSEELAAAAAEAARKIAEAARKIAEGTASPQQVPGAEITSAKTEKKEKKKKDQKPRKTGAESKAPTEALQQRAGKPKETKPEDNMAIIQAAMEKNPRYAKLVGDIELIRNTELEIVLADVARIPESGDHKLINQQIDENFYRLRALREDPSLPQELRDIAGKYRDELSQYYAVEHGITGGVDDQEGFDLFEGLDASSLPKNLQDDLEKIHSYLTSPPEELPITEESLAGLADYLEGLGREFRGKTRLSFEQSQVFNEYKQRLVSEVRLRREQRVTAQRQLERFGDVPTTIYLSERESREIRKDPIGAVDKMLAEVERAIRRDPESPIAQRNLRRLELKIDFLLSEEFDFQRAEVTKDGRILPFDEAERIRKDITKVLGKQKEKFFETYTVRLHGAQFVEAYSNADTVGGEHNRFYRFINERMNERDFMGMDGLYGGLVGDASPILQRIYAGKLYDAQAKKRLFLPTDWADAMDETALFMRDHKEAYEPRYNDYLSGKFLLSSPDEESRLTAINPEDRVAASFDDSCESIVNLAAIRSVMWMEKSAIDIRGLSPLAGQMFGEEWSSFLRKGKIERVKRFIRWHVEQWGSATGRPAAEKAFFRHQALVWAHAAPGDIGQWAQDRTDQFWPRVKKLQGAVQRGESLNPEQKKILGEVKYTFFFDPEFPTEEEELFSRIGKLTKKELFEEMRVQCGIDIADSHLLRPYVPFESGWRRETTQKIIAERLNYIFGEQGETATETWNRLFTSRRVMDAANTYYEHKFTNDTPQNRNKFLKEFHEVAGYRPHDFAAALLEQDSESIRGWFNSRLNQPEFNTYQHPGKFFTELSLRASVLNRRLLTNLEAPIDYSKGIEGITNNGQRRIIHEVFETEFKGGDFSQERYFAIMKDLSGYLQGKGSNEAEAGAIQEFLSIRYEPLLTIPRWGDDLPLDLLEHPERIRLTLLDPENKARLDQLKQTHPESYSRIIKGEIPRPISHTFSMVSEDEQSGMARRAWRDMANAERGMDLLSQLTEPSNEQKLPEILDQLWGNIAPYQGPDHAAFAVTAQLGSWLGSAKVYKRYGPLFEGLPNSSDFKKYHGPEAQSKSVDELHHIIHQVEARTGKISKNAPKVSGLMESMESHLGISNWRTNLRRTGLNVILERVLGKKYEGFLEYLNENHPSGVIWLKARYLPLYMLVLLGIYTAAEAKKGGKEEER